MAHVVCDLAKDFDLSPFFAHLHHGLRGVEADADQRFVIGLAEQHHCPSVNHLVDVASHAKDSGKGLEAAAREARYAFFDAVAKDIDARFVFVAHTADDVAASFIMNAARGSGIDGLTSHGKTRELKNATVVRPLWSVTRSKLEAYAQQRNIQWREDSSNANEAFLRNRIRSTVIPALRSVFGDDVTQRMTRTVEDLMPARSIVHTISEECANALTSTITGGVSLNLEGLTMLGSPLQTEVLRTILKQLIHQPARRADIKRLQALVSAQAGSKVSITGGLIAVRERDEIRIHDTITEHDVPDIVIDGDGAYVAGHQRVVIEHRDTRDLTLVTPPSMMIGDAKAISGKMVWRTWREGDRFQPFGMDGTTLVSDILTNTGVPHEDRRHVRVLADDEGILWVCGIRTAERLRVTESTTEIVSAQHDLVNEPEE